MKSQDYFEGFADGQMDMEIQHAQEYGKLNPNDFIHSIDLFSMWILQQLKNNGSDEIGEDGAPMFNNYGEATQAAFATTLAYARVMRIMAACLFKLNQGDFTEEHFHHEMDFAFNQLNEECDEDDE